MTALTPAGRPVLPTSVSRLALVPRATLSIPQNVPTGIPKPAGVAPRILTSPAAVSLRYLQNPPIRVRGPVTGRQYDFSGSRPVQAVDPRDASALLRTRFFRQTR
jgi:hypothetical protein